MDGGYNIDNTWDYELVELHSINATLFLNFLLKMQKEWRDALKNNDFVLKSGHLFCNSR